MSTTQGLYSNMQNLARTGQSGTTLTEGSSIGSGSDFTRSFGEMDSVAAKFAKEHGMSKGQAASMLLAASMDTAKSGMGMIAGLALGVGGSGRVDYKGTSQSAQTWKDAQETAKRNDFGQKWNNAVKAGQQEAEQRSTGSTDTSGRAFQAGFNRQRQASNNLQASMTEAQSWQSLQSRLNESGAAGNVDAVAGLMAFGRAQGVDMARLAAQATNIAGGGQSATNAAKQLDGLVNDYVASLASGKVADAPTQAGVQSAHAANLNEVEAKGSNIVPQAAQDQRDLASTGAAWGIPSSEAVAARSADIQASSGALEAGYAGVVETGGSSVQARGQPIQNEATHNSAPGNQHHVANATVQVGEAMVNTVRDIKDSASYLAGQILGGGAGSAPSSSAQNSQNQPEPWAGYHQGLPPLPEEGPPTNSQQDRPVAGGRETWVNELPK